MTASQQPNSSVTTCYVKTSDGLRSRRDAISSRPVEVVQEPGNEPEPALKVQDPFLYYSDDKNRMKELRLQDTSSSSSTSEDDDSVSPTADDEPTSTTSPTCVRKTRISFELHPSLLLEDFILGDELLGDNSLSFDDIIDGWLLDQAKKDSGEKDLINSLREVLLLSEE